MFPGISQKFLKITKDFQKYPKISKKDPMMFWSYNNTFERNFNGFNYATIHVAILIIIKIFTFY